MMMIIIIIIIITIITITITVYQPVKLHDSTPRNYTSFAPST